MYTSEQTVRLCTSWKMLSARKVKDKYGLRLHLHFDSFWFSTVKSVLHVAQDNFMHFHPACTAGAQPNSFSCSPLHKLLPAHVNAPGAMSTSFLVNPDILFLFLFSQVKNALRTNYRKLKEMFICLVGWRMICEFTGKHDNFLKLTKILETMILMCTVNI